jgi:hypothetical protein
VKADSNYLIEFCENFCKILEKFANYIVVSGFFVICSGRSRGTEDIDIIMESIEFESFKKLFAELQKHDFTCLQSSNPQEVYDYLTALVPIRIIHAQNLIPNIELKFVKDALDRYQMSTRKIFESINQHIYFSSVEANIAFKEVLLKSPKDLDDAKHLRIIYAEIISEAEIDKFKQMIKKHRL